MSDWKEKIAFLTPSSVEHEVSEGKKLKFYAVNINIAFKLKKFAGPFSKCLAVIFDNGKNDRSATSKVMQFDNPESEGMEIVEENNVQASSDSVIELRLRKKSEAIEELVSMILGQEELLMEVVMRSLRDMFDPKNMPKPDEVLKEIPAEVFVQMVIGTAKANRKVLGPFSDSLTLMFEKVKETVENSMSTDQGQNQEDQEQEDSQTNKEDSQKASLKVVETPVES